MYAYMHLLIPTQIHIPTPAFIYNEDSYGQTRMHILPFFHDTLLQTYFANPHKHTNA